VLHKYKFRDLMGLLGTNDHPFLSNRIFEVFDLDNDRTLSFVEFLRMTDLLVNGTEYE
jgi:Ca2+-binding EF-hand superfamily protein